ncbi:RadC family protein [Marinomonas sp. IMCC 4694]|uniref:RadC family protein n=1 Tax=Marinomonas sp. IMCC 4694 TaxID=2605432 RepID=UPI0011E6B301|nr:DNA repair protein RadC [Marinomonas sp. IMCC 4694]TYL47816.1 DNA repair protein RadC [Marinomonas sp. IMCC 4694]
MKNESFIYQSKEDVLNAAAGFIEERLKRENTFSNAVDAQSYVRFKIAYKESEVFAVLFLDSQHRLISFREMFQGTIDSAAVYPREIVKAAIEVNAAAVILAHNHPSGVTEPSQADISITDKIKKSLELIDVRTLDHIIVGESAVSMAERGYL